MTLLPSGVFGHDAREGSRGKELVKPADKMRPRLRIKPDTINIGELAHERHDCDIGKL